MAAMNFADLFREEAARVCDETARFERGERDEIGADEFGDLAYGLAADAAYAVSAAVPARHVHLWSPAHVWDAAALALRAGWQPGIELDLVEIKPARRAKA